MGLGQIEEEIYPHMQVGMDPLIQGDELDPHKHRYALSRWGDCLVLALEVVAAGVGKLGEVATG